MGHSEHLYELNEMKDENERRADREDYFHDIIDHQSKEIVSIKAELAQLKSGEPATGMYSKEDMINGFEAGKSYMVCIGNIKTKADLLKFDLVDSIEWIETYTPCALQRGGKRKKR